MLLCQLCGLPVNEHVTLADEETEQIAAVKPSEDFQKGDYLEYRPELKMLQNVVDISHQTTNLLKAGNLPQVLLVGGYSATNPNVYNGFQRKLSGAWNISVMMRVPIWNWGDVAYKVRAAKGATTIATLELEEAREKMELQVSQSNFRVNEANKKLQMAQASQ
jgi:outer membrane protein TolC